MGDALFTLELALAWFAATNIAVSLGACALGRLLAGSRKAEHPGRAAQGYFLLRILPGAVSLFFTVAVFLPAHWRFEPADAQESAGWSVLLFAASGAAIIALTIRHGIRSAGATASLVRCWDSAAHGWPPRAALGIPVVGLANPSPIISLVGLVRPRLYLSNSVVAELTSEELDVSLAHEAAHGDARDNLKRFVVAWCPDVLGLGGAGRHLTARWRAAMEFAADARAVGGSERRAVALASALVKMARLTPRRGPAMTAAFSHLHDDRIVAARVERLLRPAADVPASGDLCSPWPFVAAGLLVVAVLLRTDIAWLAVHEITEALIRRLP